MALEQTTSEIKSSQPSSEGANPLRELAVSASSVDLGPDTLFVDKIYSLSDVATRLVANGSALPDPRWYSNELATQWRLGRRVPPGGWTSPPDTASPNVTLEEVIKVRFEDAEPFNQVTFEMRNIASRFSIRYLDPKSKQFVDMTDKAGAPVAGHITGKPALNPTGGAQQDPETIASSAWVQFDFSVPTIVTRVVEIRMNRRVPRDEAPKQKIGNDTAPYHLKLRRLAFHLDIRVRDDAPPDEIPFNIRTALGFTERLQVLDYEACMAVEDLGMYWLSAPNPYAHSVVPYAIDMSDEQGRPQRIDRLYLEPLSPGPTMNLYWTSDRALGTFWAAQCRREVQTFGNASFVGGLKCFANGDYAEYAGARLGRLDITQDRPWTIGMRFKPNFNSNVSATDRRWLSDFAITDTFSIGICYNPVGDQFELIAYNRTGSVNEPILATSGTVSFSSGNSMTVIAGHFPSDDGSGGAFTIQVQDDTDIFAGFGLQASNQVLFAEGLEGLPTRVRFGACIQQRLGGSRSAKGTVSNVWFRQESPSVAVANGFHRRDNEFIDTRGPRDRLNGGYKALMLAPLTQGPVIRIGPGAGYYDAKAWTPVARDFVLRQGLIPLPPTHARFLKFEFSNLVPRPYPVPKGVTLIHRDYPAWVDKWTAAMEATVEGGPRVRADGSTQFPGAADQPSRIRGLPLGDTAVRRQIESSDAGSPITSPTISARPIASSPVRRHRRFYQAGVHEYVEQQVEIVNQEAYFAGLRAVRAYRIQYPTG